MSALLATFVSIKTMADGAPRITLDLQCSLAEIAAMGLMPGVPFGLARITNEASVAPVADEPKEKPGPLCVMACNFSKNKAFQQWINVDSEEAAKKFILDASIVESRKELDTDKFAAIRFHTLVREPFLAWREA